MSLIDNEKSKEQYINNAGMVLAGVYLHELFKRLDLLTDEDCMKSESAEKAVYILQYLVYGDDQSSEDFLLLNKIICGIDVDVEVNQPLELSDEDKKQVDGLLQAIIDNWKVLGGTSINGLRRKFLQRRGKLSKTDEAWQLYIECESIDVLLDELPWSYNTLSNSWMKNNLFVTWR
jgi:hypothetical protein